MISQKTNKEEGLPKRGAWKVCRFKGGGMSRKRGWCFLRGIDTPMHTMLVDQTEGERKAFLGGSKKGSDIVRLPPIALGCHKRRKNLSFCEI